MSGVGALATLVGIHGQQVATAVLTFQEHTTANHWGAKSEARKLGICSYKLSTTASPWVAVADPEV